MRQLDSCDFCGDAAEGVFEVVPGSAAGGSRRLALCTSCRETLQSVVDPLLDDADTENRTSPANAGAADSPDDEPDPRGANATPDSASEAEPAHETESASATAEETSGDGGTSEAARGSESDGGGVTIQSGSSATGSSERRPDGYAQVIRLLQNRDGAMPRDDLRALATNAYDLREQTFEEAVDAAVDNGDVEETSSGLRTT